MVSIFNKTLLSDLKLNDSHQETRFLNDPIIIVRELGQGFCLSNDDWPGENGR